jgi:hypothetical protein
MAFANCSSKCKIMQYKRMAFEKLKRIGLEHDGTIFGGFVRDEYISEYYTNKYKKRNTNSSADKYWDEANSPETNSRLLIPKDMDIGFKTKQEADEFIAALQRIYEFSKILVTSSNTSDYYSSIRGSLQSITRVCLGMQFRTEPFLNKGPLINIDIDIDIVIPIDKNLEPPFGNLDMLCNGFILTKEGKRFSKNTGTIIDKYLDYERAVVTPQILRDMVNFKTYICMTNQHEKRTINISAFQRILKMTNKNNHWTIMNMPYKYEKYTCNESQEECYICSDTLKNDDEIAYTTIQNKKQETIPSGKMHNICLMRYFQHQIFEYNNSFDDENHKKTFFCFKCPSRNIITFTRCKLDIQFVYETEL